MWDSVVTVHAVNIQDAYTWHTYIRGLPGGLKNELL